MAKTKQHGAQPCRCENHSTQSAPPSRGEDALGPGVSLRVRFQIHSTVYRFLGDTVEVAGQRQIRHPHRLRTLEGAAHTSAA
jgi:hypothetical protein